MIQEVIVVEGKQDIARVRCAVDADMIATGGFTLAPHTLHAIEQAYKKRGIIILTDPDGAGERIRRFLTKRFPEAKHAFVPKKEAEANHDIGIEQASPASIRAALEKLRLRQFDPSEEFNMQDMLKNGLTGHENAAERRASLGAALGIGYGNAKQFLQRLNHYGVTRQEFNAAVAVGEDMDDSC